MARINYDQMTLSIAIPTWNRAETLDKALAHLLPQVCLHAQNVEIIISDNASADHTPEIADKYKIQYPEVSIIYNRNEINLGFFGNFRKCRELSTGAYMWLLSDDDFVCDHVVGKVVGELLNTPDCAMIYLKNNTQSSTFSNAVYKKEEIIEKEGYSIGLISSVIFLNQKTNDEWLFDKYPGAPFAGFIFLLNAFNFRNKAVVIEGNCLLDANDVPKGYNFFDVFINGMNEVLNYMQIIEVPARVILRFKERYALKFVRPVYISFKKESILNFGNFETSDIKTINSWLVKSYGDLSRFWIFFYPAMILPAFITGTLVKIKRLFKK